MPDSNGKIDPGSTYWAETDPEQAAEAKKPYRDVKMSGLVEGRFIYTTAIARHLLPYVHLAPVPVVLPLGEKEGLLSVAVASKLIEEGYSEFGNG